MVETYPGHTTTEKSEEYKEALELAEAGKTEQALACIQEYLTSTPNDAEALNDTGAILFSLGYIEEAVNHLVKARKLFPNSAEITWNLLEVYLSGENGQQAMELLDDMERLDILSADILNRTADALLKKECLADAVKVLQRSLKISPNQEILHPMINVIRSKIKDFQDVNSYSKEVV